jgi:hypothetical protein
MAPKAAMKKVTHANLQPVFMALKAILKPYSARLRVVQDKEDCFSLETKNAVWREKPAMFAAVRIAKNYVSFHLMSVYVDKAAGGKLSPELKKRKQGKSCFNFTVIDEKLFAELKELTKSGAEAFASGRIFEMAKTMKCD